MAFLSLSDDELALLRFTCDLFFVEESPLWPIEANQREPLDYEGAYHSLVAKQVVDPHGFRITDAALNRLAPLTECDARVVHLAQAQAGVIEQRDYFLLDDIAVQYARGEDAHAVGEDLDPSELLEHLARRLVPRKSSGDRLQLRLTSLEYLALTRLLPGATAGEDLALERARALLGETPSARPAVAASPHLLAVMGVRASQGRAPRETVDPEEETVPLAAGGWDAALSSLLKKGVLRQTDQGLRVRPSLVELSEALQLSERHTFVRYDFGDDEWLMRETTFLPAPGGLFLLGAGADGELLVEELDGPSLKAGLESAVGPLPRAQSAPDPRRFRDLLGAGFSLEESSG